MISNRSLDRLRGSQLGSRQERRSSVAGISPPGGRRGSASRASLMIRQNSKEKGDSRREGTNQKRGMQSGAGTGKKSIDHRQPRIRLKDQPKGARRMQCILERIEARKEEEAEGAAQADN